MQRAHLSPTSSWLPKPRGLPQLPASSLPQLSQPREHRPCHCTVHVSEGNFLDMQYVSFLEAAQQSSSGAGRWALRVVRHEGSTHPAYPGDEAVGEWLRGLLDGVELRISET